MIGTHTAKLLNARLGVDGLRARLSGDIPPELICSATTRMRRELWALPRNAADMRVERDAVAAGEERPAPGSGRPRVDGGMKQVLLPRGDSYIAVAPIHSCGVANEVFRRLRELNLPSHRWLVQPTPAALANHGEALLLQSGALRMLRRGIRHTPDLPGAARPEDITAVQITADVTGMIGYGYLTAPRAVPWSRDGYPFAWVEAIHGQVMQSAFPSWWRRQALPWGVVWRDTDREPA